MLRGNILGYLTTLGGERLLSAQNHILNVMRIESTEVLCAPPTACRHSFRRVPSSQIRGRPVSWVQRQFLTLTMIVRWGKCVGNALWLQLWGSRSGQSPHPIPLSSEGPLNFTTLWGFQILICKSIYQGPRLNPLVNNIKMVLLTRLGNKTTHLHISHYL